jgi:hypothetical protein
LACFWSATLRRDADATGGIALVYAGDLTSWIGFNCTNGVDRDGGASLWRIPLGLLSAKSCRRRFNDINIMVTHNVNVLILENG